MGSPVVSLIEQDDAVVVRLAGHARMEDAMALHQLVAQANRTKRLAIDWHAAEFVDGCVLQVLLAAQRSLLQRGLSLTVDQDNAGVRQYLRLSGLSEYFPLQPASTTTEASEGADV